MKNFLFIIILFCFGYGQSAHLEIQNVNLTEGTLDVYMTNDVPITGFQFQLAYDCEINNIPSNCNDECCYLSVLSATGGEIVPDDWFTEGSGVWNNIMGYSSNGNMIPAGEGVLVTVSFMNYSGEEICIPVTDAPGVAYDFPIISGELIDGSATTIPCMVGDCINCDVVDDCGVCGVDNSSCTGCTDPNASNYDENATIDDDSCEYDDNWVYGCTYDTATNYNPDATFDDGSCDFMWGDVNHDGVLTIQDLILIVNEILNF